MRVLLDRRFLLIASLLVNSACGGGDNEVGTEEFIGGRVIDATTGIPVEHAMVTTAPPTEVRLTDRDGTYLLRDSVSPGQVFNVTARHVGYDAVTQTVSVAPGGTSGADFSLVTAINGLVASVSTLEIPQGEDRATLLLSSTLDDTPFSIQSSDPAFRATPAQGTLARNTLLVIEVRFAPREGQSERVAGQLVANAENGGTPITVNLVANVPPSEIESGTDQFGVLIDDAGTLINDIAGEGTGTLPDPGRDDGAPITPPAPPPSSECATAEVGTPEDRAIVVGERVAGELETLTDTDIYGFDGCAGDQIVVPFSQADGSSIFFTLSLEVRSSEGARVEETRGDNGVLVASLPADGRYTLWVTNPDQRVTGSYEFTLQRANNPAPTSTIAYGDTVQDTLEGPADLDVFTFQASAGDELVMPFSQAAGTSIFFTLHVELRDATGEPLGTVRGDNGRFEGTAVRDGLHHLWIRNPDFRVSGDYEFTLRLAN